MKKGRKKHRGRKQAGDKHADCFQPAAASCHFGVMAGVKVWIARRSRAKAARGRTCLQC